MWGCQSHREVIESQSHREDMPIERKLDVIIFSPQQNRYETRALHLAFEQIVEDFTSLLSLFFHFIFVKFMNSHKDYLTGVSVGSPHFGYCKISKSCRGLSRKTLGKSGLLTPATTICDRQCIMTTKLCPSCHFCNIAT